jgi:hypothetical protein
MSILRFVGSILFILGLALVFVGLRGAGDGGGTAGYLIGAAVLVLLGIVLFVRGRPRTI